MSKKLRSATKKLAILVMAFVFVACGAVPAFAQAKTKAPSLNANEVTIVVGKSFNFNINNKIKGSTYKWSITNEDVAVVNERGIVTGVGKGSTNVFCRINTGNTNYLLRAKVNVLKPAVKVTITNPVETLKMREFYRLKADMIPESANDIITWSSSDETIVKVDPDGSFVPRKPGTVTITATTVSGRSDSVTIIIPGDEDVADTPDDSKDVIEEKEDTKEEIKVGKTIYEENFETSLGGFVARQGSSATVTRSSAGRAAEGSGYMSVTGRTSSWHGATVDVTEKVKPGASYLVTAWVRYTTGEDVEIIKATQQATTREGEIYPPITQDQEIKKGEWTQISGIMVVPPSATNCQVYFEANSLIDFYVDHVVIQEVEADIIEEDLSDIKPAEVGDIIYKNDFEGDRVLDARANSVRTITSEVARRGKASLKVERDNSWDGAGVNFTKANDIEILSLYGRTVHASFYVMYNEGPDEVQFKLNNKMEKADNSDVILSQIAVKKGEWTLIEADCYIAENVPANLIFVETEDEAVTFYVDDVEIVVVK